MSEDDAPEAEEPTDEDIAEVLGEEPVQGVRLPVGSETLPLEDSPFHERGNGIPIRPVGDKQEGLVCDFSSDASPRQIGASGCEEVADAPETLEKSIEALPALWMRLYVRALYDTGDPVEARKVVKLTVGTVLPGTVARFAKECPAFGHLISEHQAAQHQAVDAAVYRGATEGDVMPIAYQGVVMDTYRRRSDKAAEVHYRRHGLMAADQVNVTHAGRVEVMDDAKVVTALENVARLLFGQAGPKPVAGKVVSESDKGAA